MTEKTLLEYITKVRNLSKEKGLSTPFFTNARHYLDVLSTELPITPIQAALYAHVFGTTLTSPPIFSKPGRFLYFGYPGSGTVSKLAGDAANLMINKNEKYTIVSYDDYHIGTNERLKFFADLIGLNFKSFSGPVGAFPGMLEKERIGAALIYLRGFTNPIDFCKYDLLFSDKTFTKVLVLDCTRKDTINNSLIAEIGRENLDAVILTKIDRILDEEDFFEFIGSLALPVVGFSDKEKIDDRSCLWYKR